jgi:hypothetical protein
VDQHRLADPVRVALLEQETVPSEQRRDEAARTTRGRRPQIAR